MVEEKPILVTLFLFSYNQEKYIEAACHAALAQNYSPLEIIISDDFSTDNTYRLAKEIVSEYNGPHKICCRQNNKNLGLIEHVNMSFQLAAGELIVAAAGDDISMPNRVKRLVQAFIQSNKKALVIHSSVIKITEWNEVLDVMTPPVTQGQVDLKELAFCNSIYIGATAAWNRQIYEIFGPIIFQDTYEDLVLGFRGALNNLLIYIDIPLVKYRINIGLSSQQCIPFWNFSSRLVRRKRVIKRFLDTIEQRFIDFQCVRRGDNGEVNARFIDEIKYYRARNLCYTSPLILLSQFFSRNFFVVCKVAYIEVRYWIAGTFTGAIASFLALFFKK